jgi:hypothetical protein
MHRRFLNKADVPLPVPRMLVTWPGCFGSRQHPWDFTLRSFAPIGESPASLPAAPRMPFSLSSPRSFSSRDQPPLNSLTLHPLLQAANQGQLLPASGTYLHQPAVPRRPSTRRADPALGLASFRFAGHQLVRRGRLDPALAIRRRRPLPAPIRSWAFWMLNRTRMRPTSCRRSDSSSSQHPPFSVLCGRCLADPHSPHSDRDRLPV